MFVLPVAGAAGAAAASSSATRPSSASIRTPDFDETVRWYQDNLGFRLLSTRSLVQGRTALLERSGFLLEITEADHPVPETLRPTGEAAVTRVPVVSLLVPDVDSEIARLKAKGIEVLQVPEDDLEGTYRVAEIRDNSRHRIELREPLGTPGSFNAYGR